MTTLNLSETASSSIFWSCHYKKHNRPYMEMLHDCAIHMTCLHMIYFFQVYPQSWTAIYMPLDNVGMWNIRSESWARQYLGQQFYLRVYSPANSWRDENPIPKNALLCGRASGRRTRPLWTWIGDQFHVTKGWQLINWWESDESQGYMWCSDYWAPIILTSLRSWEDCTPSIPFLLFALLSNCS